MSLSPSVKGPFLLEEGQFSENLNGAMNGTFYFIWQESGIEECFNTIEVLIEEKKEKDKLIEELKMSVQKDKVSNSWFV